MTPDAGVKRPLGDLADYVNGRAFKQSEWGKQGLPIIRIAQLTNPSAEPNYYSGEDIDPRHRVNDGDLLFSWSATLAVVKWSGGPAVLNQHIFKVTERPGVDRDFLSHLLVHSIPSLAEESHGSTMKHIRKGVLDGFSVWVPRLPEQRKIAAILSSIDETIELTERLVDQNQRLTEVLRDHVLTHGIGRAGRLRSQTWFGEVPSDWTETTLGAIAEGRDGLQTGPFGSQLHASDYTLDGIPVLMPRDLKDGRIDPDSVAKVPLAIAEEMSRHRLKPGDILFGRRGEIGRSALVTEAEAGWLCGTGCLRARLTETVVPEFVIEVFRSSQIIKWLNENAVGQTMLNLNTDILARMPVLLPPIAEQRQIADLLASPVRARAATVDELGQLRLLKSALLSALLSGELRVISAEAAA